MGDLVIRNTRQGEQAAMITVTVEAYKQYAPHISPGLWERYEADIKATVATEGMAEKIIAEKDGVIIGSVLLYPAGTTFDIQGDGEPLHREYPQVRLLAVLPTARGQGIGLKLMTACIQRAREAGAQKLTLHTTDMMQVAVKMYKRLGFVHMPELDFTPFKNIVIKGYSLNLE